MWEGPTWRERTAAQSALKGKVQKGERLLPRSRRAGAGDEAGRGSGRNRRGVSRRDFAACRDTEGPRTNPGPEWKGLGCFLSRRLFLCCSCRGCWLNLVRTIGFRFDGLGLLRGEYLLGLSEQVRLVLVRNADVVGEEGARQDRLASRLRCRPMRPAQSHRPTVGSSHLRWRSGWPPPQGSYSPGG